MTSLLWCPGGFLHLEIHPDEFLHLELQDGLPRGQNLQQGGNSWSTNYANSYGTCEIFAITSCFCTPLISPCALLRCLHLCHFSCPLKIPNPTLNPASLHRVEVLVLLLWQILQTHQTSRKTRRKCHPLFPCVPYSGKHSQRSPFREPCCVVTALFKCCIMQPIIFFPCIELSLYHMATTGCELS